MTAGVAMESVLHGRRRTPLLILSQDYELFFGKSGSLEKCLFEPCDLLTSFASKNDVEVTYFVDAGMLRRMQQIESSSRLIQRQLSKIKKHIEMLSKNGHEIGLHVHPHWEDTTWTEAGWQFANTRYQLRDFSDDEVSEILTTYTTILNNLSAEPVTTYRAGGFCVEPFDRIGKELTKLGISVDSSVVPGARLRGHEKGFDFSGAVDRGWWRFDHSPLVPRSSGRFIEIPITPNVLPLFFYWGRLFERLSGRRPPSIFGDGSSKAIGLPEVLRRLAGGSRIAELSIDGAKVEHLSRVIENAQNRIVWQIMGHPKLLSRGSLRLLQDFISQAGIGKVQRLSSVAQSIRDGDLGLT